MTCRERTPEIGVVEYRDDDSVEHEQRVLEHCRRIEELCGPGGAHHGAGGRFVARRVVCVETGEVFTSMEKAKRFAKGGNVWQAVRKNVRAGGFHWRYAACGE